MNVSSEDIIVTGIGFLITVGEDVEEGRSDILAGRCGIRQTTVAPIDREIKVADQPSI